ncbi:formate dehydrogenase accessory sulfurtransferase FdhD [Nakamurella lactea]|uniref:formate dehydrogenase accessory sulfurtransferase FdhD n=1 Tax=Nakamurella lactea TaxID=459515 RepID=UPI00040D70D2|nr:formate dehydrogenase accessory sulfurtransferase FdhD [Nakamurella lactea]
MRASKRRPVLRLRTNDTAAGVTEDTRADLLAGEEPLEIRVGGVSFAVTMRTPGNDFDLAIGFLLSEGMITSAGEIAEISYGPGVDADGSASYNIVDVRLAAGVPPPDPALARQLYTSSSCGVCGTSSIKAVTKQSGYAVALDSATVPLTTLLALPERLRQGQQLFRRTGGTHAAGLFAIDDQGDAELLYLREDVGRHNAVDKVTGAALRDAAIPLRHTVLQVSGRASFELVQKASMAGIPVLSAVSSPSALAVELAEEVGLTLAGFSRGDSVNIYSGSDRIRR